MAQNHVIGRIEKLCLRELLIGGGSALPLLAAPVNQLAQLEDVVLIVHLLGLIGVVGAGIVRLQVLEAVGIFGIVVGVGLGHHLHGNLGAEQAVDEHRAVGGDGGVRVGIAQADGELFHLLARACVLHAVLHADVHILGQRVDLAVALVPQLQCVVALKLIVPDGLVQIANVGEDFINGADVLFKTLQGVFFQGIQLVGVGPKQAGQRLGRGPGQIVVILVGVALQLTQGCGQLHQLGIQQAVAAVFALAHLIQDGGDLLKAAQHGVVKAYVGGGVAVADIQIGVPDLVDAGDQRAVTHVVVIGGAVHVAGAGFQAHLVDALAGVARGVDVGNVVAGHPQSVLGGIDTQAGGGEGVKGADHTHSNTPLAQSAVTRGNLSSYFGAAPHRGAGSPRRAWRGPPRRRRWSFQSGGG